MVHVNVIEVKGYDDPGNARRTATHTERCEACGNRFNVDVFETASVSCCAACGRRFVLAPGHNSTRSITDKEQFVTESEALRELENL